MVYEDIIGVDDKSNDSKLHQKSPFQVRKKEYKYSLTFRPFLRHESWGVGSPRARQ
jgi:hypothetical protein